MTKQPPPTLKEAMEIIKQLQDIAKKYRAERDALREILKKEKHELPDIFKGLNVKR
jgi:hypothetical protein